MERVDGNDVHLRRFKYLTYQFAIEVQPDLFHLAASADDISFYMQEPSVGGFLSTQIQIAHFHYSTLLIRIGAC